MQTKNDEYLASINLLPDLKMCTEKQTQAVKQSGNVLVSAGAGSGKTQVLTLRVIWYILKHNYSIKDFLILTFTNLAAAEMKDRIRKALTKKNLEDANIIDSADITTFDAFALNIVKKYHNILNLDGDIKNIPNTFIKVKLHEYLEEILEEFYHDQRFIDVLDKYTFDDDKDIFNIILSAYELGSSNLSYEKYFDEFIDKYFNKQFMESIMNNFDKQKEKIRKEIIDARKDVIDSDCTYKGVKNRNALEIFDTEFNEYIHASVDESVKYFPLNFSVSSKPFKPIKDVINKAKALIPKLPTRQEFYDSIEEKKALSELILEIIKKLHKKIMEFKMKNNAFEFNDIAMFAYKIVKENIDIRNELKSKYKMIMIDEFQDTSYMQDELMKLIENNNLYTVGDIKQSIYRFRNSRCDLFLDKYNLYKQQENSTVIDMNKNFRSRDGVLDDVNYLFSYIMEGTSQINYLQEHQLDFGSISYPKVDNSNFDFILYKANEYVHLDVEDEAKIIAKDIIKKMNAGYKVYDKETKQLRPCRLSDFCIIVDRGTNFGNFYDIFSEYNIPLFIENDEDISTNIIFKLLKNILILFKTIYEKDLDSIEFKHSYASVARSFLFNYDDEKLYNIYINKSFEDDEIYKIFLESSKLNLPFYDRFIYLLNKIEIYNKFFYYGNYLKLENYLDEYLNAFKTLGELNYTVDEFIEALNIISDTKSQYKINIKGLNIDSVKIINIHKSKGLEYPICYFPLLYGDFNRKDINKRVRVDSKYGIIFDHDNGKDYRLDLAFENELKIDNEEKIRLLYVALTRAREKAIFVIRCNKSTKDEESRDEAVYNKIYLKNLNNIIKEYNKYSFETLKDLFEKEYISKDLFYGLCYLNKYKLNNIDVDINKYKNKYDCDYELLEAIISDYNNNYISLDDAIDLFDYFGYSLNEDIDTIYDSIDKDNSINLRGLGYVDPNYNLIISILTLGEDENSIDKDEIKKVLDLLQFKYNDRFLNYINDKNIEDRYNYFMMFNKDIKIDKINYASIILNGYHNNAIKKTTFMHILNYNNSNLYNIIYNYINIIISDNASKKVFFDILDEANIKYSPEFISYMDNVNINNLDIFEERFLYFIENDYNINYDHDFKVATNKLYLKYGNDTYYIDSLIKLCGMPQVNNEIYKCFKDMIIPYVNENNSSIYLKGLKINKLKENEEKDKEVESEKLELIEINPDLEEIEYSRASKKLNVDTKKELLEFGTKIHYVMETLDFNNPDYSKLDKFYIDIIKRFLNSSLMKDYKSGIIYKEYEFIDEINNKNGIIDLMVVYNNHIDIIDYKTKEIDDDAYNIQLNVYKDYIIQNTDKKINMYLYSLLTGEVREVE